MPESRFAPEGGGLGPCDTCGSTDAPRVRMTMAPEGQVSYGRVYCLSCIERGAREMEIEGRSCPACAVVAERMWATVAGARAYLETGEVSAVKVPASRVAHREGCRFADVTGGRVDDAGA